MICALSRTLRATSAAAAPDTGVDRLPYVPSPNGVWSVSPLTTWMSAGGIPISSATICANVVSWPCPWLMQETRSTALPVGCTRSSLPSAMPSPRMSMSLRGPAPTASVKNATPIPISSPRARFSACSRRRSSYPAISSARSIAFSYSPES